MGLTGTCAPVFTAPVSRRLVPFTLGLLRVVTLPLGLRLPLPTA
jgi:hypothetical protein